jgi:glycosyltransferase involved in cell wall biosynthesis
MRILAFIPQLGPGGAERTMSRLTAHLAERHDIELMTWEAPDATSFYTLAPNVTVIRADLFGGTGLTRLTRIAARIFAVRRKVGEFRPDVVLSFMDAMNLIVLAACIATRVPVVISERVDPRHHDIGRFKALMRWVFYPLASRLVVQTRRIADYFPARLQKRISVIANGVALPSVMAAPKQPGANGRFAIVTAGRLTYQKAFDGLIASFALVADLFPDWDLTIFGEGEERSALEKGIQDQGLAERVRLPGVRKDLAAEFAKAHIIAFPSRYEGFPNVLAEGLAAGLPAVGYSGVSGVEDLILDRRTGILAAPLQDHAAFANALSILMKDGDLRERMGAAAHQHVSSWSPDRILARWEDVLAAAVTKVSCRVVT